MRAADRELDCITQSPFPRRRRKEFERVARHRPIMPGALDRVFERAMLPHRRQRKFEIALAHLAFFQSAAPEITLLRLSAPERKHHRQGDLSLAEIVADVLAELGRCAAIIERVVDQLKGDAEIGAVALTGGALPL